MYILWHCTQHTETLQEGSAPVFIVRGPCGKDSVSQRKQGGYLQSGHLLLCLNSEGLKRLRMVHCYTNRIPMLLSASGACLESAMKKGSKAVQEYTPVAYKKDFVVQIFWFAQNGRWVPTAVPAYGSPCSILDWGN